MHNYILVCHRLGRVGDGGVQRPQRVGVLGQVGDDGQRCLQPFGHLPGDRVVIYVGGQQEGSKLFVASAEVVSCELVTAVARRNVAPNVAEGNQLAVGWLQLGTVKEFSTPVPILELLDRLSFIPENRARWGVALVGGVRRIDDRDWDLILSEAAGASKSSDV